MWVAVGVVMCDLLNVSLAGWFWVGLGVWWRAGLVPASDGGFVDLVCSDIHDSFDVFDHGVGPFENVVKCETEGSPPMD